MVAGIYFALKMLRKHPLRIGLTLIQITVGIMVLTIVLGFIFSILNLDQRNDQNSIYLLTYSQKLETDMGLFSIDKKVFTPEMVKHFRDNNNYLEAQSLVSEDSKGLIEYQGVRYSYDRFYGTGPEFKQVLKIRMVKGNFFTRADLENRSRVLIISSDAASQLFEEDDCVDKEIQWIDSKGKMQQLKIIGLYENIDPPQPGIGIHFIVPYTIMEGKDSKHLMDELWVAFIKTREGKAKDEISVLFNQEIETKAFDQGGELKFEKMYDYDSEIRQEILSHYGLLLGAFAFIAFVVSLLGVLSVMIVSIVERTREIGLRRAMGASKFDISSQIIIESIFVSLLGGIVGIILAYFATDIAIKGVIPSTTTNMLDIKIALSFEPVLISLISIIMVGFLAGFYPGIQAMQLNLVTAIRDK